ncbi:VOC family protein [Arthrobacter sp. MDT1-65]
MLRVRPLVATSDLPAAAGFLRALGLHPAQEPVADGSRAVFDAGSGRVALRTCAPGSREEGRAALAFDVGDVREFARRTVEAGTAVGLSGEGSGLTARITAPDGTSFPVEAGPRETGAPASPLAVLAVWSTPDVDRAARVLGDMGARPRAGARAGTRRDFRAKNGGLVAVRAAARGGVGLAFEYDGDVRDLLGNLTAGGSGPVVSDGSDGRSLRVRAPWGAGIRVDERRGDLSGHPTS